MTAPTFRIIVEEIMSTHHALLRRELPKITDMLKSLTGDAESAPLDEAQMIFQKVRSKVETHLRDEETVLFPTGIALESGSPPEQSEMNFLERLAEMEKEHDGCSKTLDGVSQTIAEHAPDSELKDKLLKAIELVQLDFVSHVDKENNKVHPMLIKLIASH